MTAWKLLVLGAVIGSNNLAVALALGALGQTARRGRVTLVFGVFEFVIPLVGIWLGRQASAWLSEQVSWLAPVLIGALGLWSLAEAWRNSSEDEALARRVTSWSGLILLAGALGLDNLIVGFGLGLRGAEPLVVSGVIAAFAVVFTQVGMRVGDAARRHWRRSAEVGSGVLLLALALAIWAGWI